MVNVAGKDRQYAKCRLCLFSVYGTRESRSSLLGDLRYSNDAGSLCVSGLRMCVQMTTGANMVEAVALKEGFCVILFFPHQEFACRAE